MKVKKAVVDVVMFSLCVLLPVAACSHTFSIPVVMVWTISFFSLPFGGSWKMNPDLVVLAQEGA